MVKKTKASKVVTVAWECRSCGHRHTWEWPRFGVSGEFSNYRAMACDECGGQSTMLLIRVSRDVWAAAW